MFLILFYFIFLALYTVELTLEQKKSLLTLIFQIAQVISFIECGVIQGVKGHMHSMTAFTYCLHAKITSHPLHLLGFGGGAEYGEIAPKVLLALFGCLQSDPFLSWLVRD